MFRTSMSALLAALALLIAPAGASAVVIDFTAQPIGNNPNPLVLPGATFSTLGGFNVIEFAFGSNILCPSITSAGSADCPRDLEVLFDAPASGLSFTFVANNTTTIGSDVGDVQLFAGVAPLGTVDLIVQDASSLTFDLVDLGGFSGVTRLLISSDDFGGLLYDDFTFSSTVPEPASWTMMIAGIGLVWLIRRRKS